MRRALICAIVALPSFALAQPAPEMVMMPKALVEAARSWIGHPDATTAVQIYAALQQCETANAGKTAEGCPAVVAALKAQREALSKSQSTLPQAETPAPVAAPAK